MRAKRFMVLQIKGVEWIFYFQSARSYVRMHAKHGPSDGITYPSKKEVYLRADRLVPKIVRHELMHCYVESSDTYSSDLKADQVEDLCCVIVGEHGAELFHLSDRIIEFFSR